MEKDVYFRTLNGTLLPYWEAPEIFGIMHIGEHRLRIDHAFYNYSNEYGELLMFRNNPSTIYFDQVVVFIMKPYPTSSVTNDVALYRNDVFRGWSTSV